jgi:hypothetical protein
MPFESCSAAITGAFGGAAAGLLFAAGLVLAFLVSFLVVAFFRAGRFCGFGNTSASFAVLPVDAVFFDAVFFDAVFFEAFGLLSLPFTSPAAAVFPTGLESEASAFD